MTRRQPDPLTPAQLDCLRIIHELTEADGHCPAYDTIRVEMGMASKSGVARLLDILEEKRWIRRIRGRKFSIEVVCAPPPLRPYDVYMTPKGVAYLQHRSPAEGT